MVNEDFGGCVIVEQRSTTVLVFVFLASFGFESAPSDGRFILVDGDTVTRLEIFGTN